MIALREHDRRDALFVQAVAHEVGLEVSGGFESAHPAFDAGALGIGHVKRGKESRRGSGPGRPDSHRATPR